MKSKHKNMIYNYITKKHKDFRFKSTDGLRVKSIKNKYDVKLTHKT